MIAAALVTGAVVAPAAAQDDRWDDESAYELEDLSDLLALDFDPGMFWMGNACDDDEDCDVSIGFDDGENLIVVNGDTLRNWKMRFPHVGPFAFDFKSDGDHRPHFKMRRHFQPHHGWQGDPEIRRMEHEARTLARKARRAEGDEKAGLEKELDAKLNAIFDLKLEKQEKAIQRAEERVERLKERRKKRLEARDEIIQDRKEELVGRERYMEW